MRKKILVSLTILAFVMLPFFAFKADYRLRFKKYNWTDIGRSAKSQNKMIFVLITGDYCSTTKKMDRVMTDSRVCTFYNKNFVSTRFDSENLGQYFRASNWGISQVPALVFLDKNQKVIHKVEGRALNVKDMIAEGEVAIEISKCKK